jgi:5'-methylthioadenosine phosphorylase
VESPRFEIPAEIQLYGAWRADIVGKPLVPELVFVREAELPFDA